MTTSDMTTALVIGIGFGWFLERGGLGNARKLAGQFYLTDLTVFKVMFSAIITAALGLFWLARLGLIEPSAVFVPPTYVLPQLAGGLVFGLGFVMAGLCPGTSCVSAATGRGDGLAAMAGMLAGVFAFHEIYPVVQPFYDMTPLGVATLPSRLGLSPGLATSGLVALALLSFLAAARFEAGRAGP